MARRGDRRTLGARGDHRTLAEAQLVSVATQSGKLTPVLRNPADIVIAEDFPETTRADVLEAEKVAEAQNRKNIVPSAGEKIERVQ